jgi:hypothetical protein
MQWNGVAVSADGSHMAASVFYGGVYVSTNSGATWSQTAVPTGFWYGMSSSADGSHMAVAGSVNEVAPNIYVYTNSGPIWANKNIPQASGIGRAVAFSADGTRLVAANFTGQVYVSTNNGTTWITNNTPVGNWPSVAASADGSKLLAGLYGGSVYVSTNGGVNWNPASAPSGIEWNAVASSADGSRLVAMAASGQIYTWQYAPVLSCVSSNGAAVVSWPDSVYTNIFTLQTNGDLTTANWANAGLPVNDNGTNQSVTITPLSTNLFFRLSQ